MTALQYLRHPSLLLAAVAVAIGFVWYALGYPTQLPRSPLSAGERLECLSYAPGTGEVPMRQIETDLARLAPHAGCVRTYQTGGGLDRVPEVARRLELQVLQGVALGRDKDRNNAEIERAFALAKSQRPAIRAFVVGSDVLSKGDLSAAEIGAQIRRVRETTGLPVTYADRPESWTNSAALAAAVDFVTVNVELYGADAPTRPSDVARVMLDVRSRVAARVGNKAVMVGEVGACVRPPCRRRSITPVQCTSWSRPRNPAMSVSISSRVRISAGAAA
jgi:glucan 1,3-beta-glucosidase